MKQSSIFKAQKSMSSRILCCASEGSFNIRIPTNLGRTELQGSNPEEAAEIMMVSMESRLNSSGTSSLKSVGELSEVCSPVVLKCLYLARIGRPDFLWSVNKLARSITKLTKACDKRLNRLISYIHHTCEDRQYCHVGNTAKQCRLGLFQDSDCGRS